MADGSRKSVIFESPEQWIGVTDVLQRKLREMGFQLLSFEEVFANRKLQEDVVAIIPHADFTSKVNKVLPLLSNVSTISFTSAGFEGLDFKECLRQNVTVGNTSLALKDAVADFCLTLMLASARVLLPGIKAARTRQSLPKIPRGMHVTGCTLGVVGMGRIGYEAAKKAYGGFQMKILYYDVNQRSQEDEACIQATHYASLHEMLPQCDIILLTCSLNKTTFQLFGQKEFSLMKSSAIIVNVSRGPVINTEELQRALEAGEIGGAALDVTDPEPLPEDHPLLDMPNVIIAAHQASRSSPVSNSNVVELTVQNLLRGLEGKPLVCPLPLESLAAVI